MPKLTYSIDGQEHTVEVTDSCSIGRADTNDIALESEVGASRRHIQIMKLAKSYEMTDLGSTNGTRVNGKATQRHRLEHGDKIRIGDTELVWKERDDGDEIDLEEEISLEGDAPKSKKSAASGGQSYLVYAGGANDGQRITLDKSRITFGRRSSNTVAIESAAVSGYHCEITREGGSYVLRDLGSTNGTVLDGEPVGESALQHGARIGIGDQRLVFVDPSISDFEKAMAGVDDLGSEWGMLRAEMDMSRVQKARRSQIVAVVAVVAVIGVIGYVFLANPELLQEKGPTIAVREGNEVPDPSFENLASGWAAAPSSPVSGAFGEGEGKQGTSFYTVSRDGAAGRLSIVELTEKEFTVRPGQAYEFGANVRTSGGGQAVVRVLWVGAGEGAVGAFASSTGVTSASSWTEVSSSAVPPVNATRARLQLVNAGEGSVDFDDVFFLAGSGSAKGAQVSDGGLEVSVSADGAVTISRSGEPIVSDMRVVGGALGGGADRGVVPDRAGTADMRAVAGSSGSAKLTGTVLDPYSNTSGDFEVTFTPSEGRYVDVSGTLPEGAALVGILPSSVMDKTVGIWTASSSFRESQTRFVQAAKRVSVGAAKRYEVSAGDGEFRFALLFDGNVHGAAFGPTEATLALRFDTDTRTLNEMRDQLLGAAEAAESQGRIGDAMKLFDDYASEFAEGDSKQDSARKRSLALKAQGDNRVATLLENSAGAIAYGETDALHAALAEANELITKFGRTEAEQVRTKVQEALAARGRGAAEVAATPQLARAQDYQKSGSKRLASALYRDVVARFPGTDAAKTAETALGAMGQ